MKIHEHIASSRQPRVLLNFAALLTGTTFVAELLGGLWINSLALLSDAGHAMMDLAAILLSLFALRLAERPATDRRTYGLHRLEVFAAFLNGALVSGVALWILIESIDRLRAPPTIKTDPMLFLALLGLAVNLIVAWQLHGFAPKDINIRGAFLHVTSDALASVGVLAGGILIKVTGRFIIDPLVGIFVAGIIVLNAFRLLKASVHILLEGVPEHIRLQEVIGALRSVPGVKDVEDTHVWNICSHISSLSAHITVSPDRLVNQHEVLENIHGVLRDRFKIAHTTIEIHSTDWKRSDKF